MRSAAALCGAPRVASRSSRGVAEVLHLHRQSAFLAGRERRVSDIPLDNPSCSTQHAVVQFRLKEKHTETGERIVTVRCVRPAAGLSQPLTRRLPRALPGRMSWT